MDRQTDKHWDVKMAANTIKVRRVVLPSKISYPANNLRVNSDKTYGGRAMSYIIRLDTYSHFVPFQPEDICRTQTWQLKKNKQSPDNLWNVWICCRERKDNWAGRGWDRWKLEEGWRRDAVEKNEEGRGTEEGGREAKRWQTQEKACKAWSIVILLVCVEGYLSSHFFLLSSNISFLPPRSLLWSLSAPLLLFPISLFFTLSFILLCAFSSVLWTLSFSPLPTFFI